MEPTKELPQGDAPPAAVAETTTEVPAAPIVSAEVAPTVEITQPPMLGEAPQLAVAPVASDIAVPPAVSAAPPVAPAASAPSAEPELTAVVPPPVPAAAVEAPQAASAEMPKSDSVEILGGVEAPKTAAELPKTAKVAPPLSAVTLSNSGRIRTPTIAAHVRTAPPRTNRFGLLAASVAAAAIIGAAGGAAGYAGMSKWAVQPQPVAKVAAPAPQRAEATDEVKALRESIAQVRGSVRALSESVTALRANTDSAGKSTQAQLAKLNEAVERSQTEPNARLAKLTEAVDRLDRRGGTANAAPVAQPPAPDMTGSLRPPPLPPLGGDPRATKPVIEGWALRSVNRGVAIVQGRMGSYEVEVGDDIRGAGRVQDIKRQHDGRWVVVTSRGMIMPNTPIR